MAIIYHLTSQEAWQAAQPLGEYEAPSLAEEGFIHCSIDEAQLLRVAERLYQGRRDLQVVDVDVENWARGSSMRSVAPVKNTLTSTASSIWTRWCGSAAYASASDGKHTF